LLSDILSAFTLNLVMLFAVDAIFLGENTSLLLDALELLFLLAALGDPCAALGDPCAALGDIDLFLAAGGELLPLPFPAGLAAAKAALAVAPGAPGAPGAALAAAPAAPGAPGAVVALAAFAADTGLAPDAALAAAIEDLDAAGLYKYVLSIKFDTCSL
jgi:hypothetical protein